MSRERLILASISKVFSSFSAQPTGQTPSLKINRLFQMETLIKPLPLLAKKGTVIPWNGI